MNPKYWLLLRLYLLISAKMDNFHLKCWIFKYSFECIDFFQKRKLLTWNMQSDVESTFSWCWCFIKMDILDFLFVHVACGNCYRLGSLTMCIVENKRFFSQLEGECIILLTFLCTRHNYNKWVSFSLDSDCVILWWCDKK